MHSTRVAALFVLWLVAGVEGLRVPVRQRPSWLEQSNVAASQYSALANMIFRKSFAGPGKKQPNGISLLDMSIKDSPWYGENGRHIMEWARKHILEEGHMSDTSVWPELHTPGNWDTGLNDPHVYVLSMKPDTKRRTVFADRFAKLGFKVSPGSAHWSYGINGSLVPQSFINPNGDSATGSEKFWRENLQATKGGLGCFVSHMLALREHAKRCPTCDMVIFDDDVEFHPEFQKLWGEFYNSLPEKLPIGHSNEMAPIALLHIGGDAFWERPWQETPTFFQVDGVSRMWGVVIKAHAVESILDGMLSSNEDLNQRADQLMSTGTILQKYDLVSVAPKFPLVFNAQCGGSSHTEDTSYNDNEWIEECLTADTAMDWGKACWGHVYEKGKKVSCAPRA